MLVSCADLYVGEVRRRVLRLPHYDWRDLAGFCPVAELTIRVVSPSVGVPVATHSQGKTKVRIFCSADLAESDTSVGAVWWGDGGGFPAQLAALIGVDAPRAVPACRRPFRGQGQVACDGFAEVVGDLVDEPSVE